MLQPASAGPFRLSIWTSLYWDLSPEDALRHIADQGWGAVDLSCEHLGVLWRADDADRVKAWRALAEELDVQPYQCHLFMDLNLVAPDERALNIDRCAEHLRLASRLGVENAVMHRGWVRKGEQGPDDDIRDAMTESLTRLAPTCAETGVRIAVENMMGGFGTQIADLTTLAQATDPEWIGKGNDLADTQIFHLIRATHIAGRCVDCGACERACPMGIELRRLTRKVRKDVKELFGAEAGAHADDPPALGTYDPEDPEDGITQ